MTQGPTIGSLFAGIGGLELGLSEGTGGAVAWQVENDPAACRVLRRRFPDSKLLAQNIQRVDFTCMPRVALLCGGFPCQDLSSAGKQAGLSGEKSGLWFEFARAVNEQRPRAVVVENVHGKWREWLPAVRGDLWAIGYASVSIQLRASDVGGPFPGKRVFVVAASDSEGQSALRQHAQVEVVQELAEACRADWGQPSPEALGMADGVPGRVDRLRMAGNAVVPRMAKVVGRFLGRSIFA